MNITLIGMPGAGKSLIGRELAKKLNYRFIDVDEIIEEKNGLKLQEIIDRFGDGRFKEIEEKTILELTNSKPRRLSNSVISPGGSVVYSEEAMRFLKKVSIVVFLNPSLKNIKTYNSDFSARGVVGLKKKSLEQLHNERLPLYRRYADVTMVLPENFDVERVVGDIVDKIFQRSD
ncbi:shikimate kinase [Candidatus Woesearchaeota archaeon CG08_land_8_20_14_0_20_47_9]|nr:MAG: hypothetical protein AUJ69_02855 [Candidatus Woesearchaeota archaeon CG1_02_47_18]PIN74077.1 MAG: shikimate kinase [Candidatus Woesearchaeota archaeon CG10_big_fil_rev_8_21_14_0_10_47_5]PIO03444.1 MAG: shikimate kinase [Candidatus Woesearchaeota archaeon CG08_land_8_20_14_0_20_47_9]HII30195.1 shikimate kinase [Candidatus Woesearchaeota archaeon]